MRIRFSAVGMALVLAALAACGESTPTTPGGPTLDQPGAPEARYEWALDGWTGARPVGQPTVLLSWQVPTRWGGEPFRVYGRRSTDRDYRLIATVTACAQSLCRYTDSDLAAGRTYEYYVAVVDERSGQEVTSPSAVAVDVPAANRPARPEAPQVVALDSMLYVHWRDAAVADVFPEFLVFLERQNGDSVFTRVGSTDGTGFLDTRVRNGVAYRYSVAVVDGDGHVSDRSPLSGAGIPRPDYHAELIYAYADSVQLSGFRFPPAEDVYPVLSGDAATAQWRLEADPSGWRIRPLAGASVLDAGFTSALTCGPGADLDCLSVDQAPAAGYVTGAVELVEGHTYVVRVNDGGAIRYGKLRVGFLAADQRANRFMIFDWAFQTVPGVPNLNLGG